MKINKTVLTIAALLCSASLFAQEQPEMADAFRKEGKIYVLVAVVVAILAGLLSFMFLIDRKVTNLEKKRSAGKH